MCGSEYGVSGVSRVERVESKVMVERFSGEELVSYSVARAHGIHEFRSHRPVVLDACLQLGGVTFVGIY